MTLTVRACVTAQACARTEEDLRRTATSVQSEIVALKAAAARSAEEAAAGSVRDAATAEGRVALQSKRDELHRTVARLKAELAKTKAEAKRTDQRTFLLLKRLLSERETLSKQRDLAYEQMEAKIVPYNPSQFRVRCIVHETLHCHTGTKCHIFTPF